MKYFQLQEFTKTQTGLKNEIETWEQMSNVLEIAHLLDEVREELGLPIVVNSGFRGDGVNRAVKGSINSAHLKGAAADVRCEDNEALLKILLTKIDKIDQLIIYKDTKERVKFLHVGIKFNRNQVIINREPKL